jgi:hypothetical protein
MVRQRRDVVVWLFFCFGSEIPLLGRPEHWLRVRLECHSFIFSQSERGANAGRFCPRGLKSELAAGLVLLFGPGVENVFLRRLFIIVLVDGVDPLSMLHV